MPPPHNPESVTRPGSTTQDDGPDAQLVAIKPPLPNLSFARSRLENIDVRLPHVIAGALVAAFANTLADGLGNELLTHYYLSDQRVRVNLDRVFDGLMNEFTARIYDELWEFYLSSNAQHARQISLLFEGPVRQMILSLNGPELSRCVLDRIGPGLSRRPMTWTNSANGVDLALALQLVCRWWHHEHPSRSPGGNPDDIARTIVNHTTSGKAFTKLINRVKQVLYTPHYVQMHLMDSAVWEIVMKRPFSPPSDGYRVLQFRFECDPRQRIMDEGHIDLGSFSAIIGTHEKCLLTTVSQYVSQHWPRCGPVAIRCLTEAFTNAAQSFQQDQTFTGMSVWDDSNPDAALCPGLRLLHVEVEEGLVRISVSAWVLALVEVLQQMAWTCAAISSSPFPEAISECALQVIDWNHTKDSTFVNCSLTHRAVPEGDCAPWLQQRRGAVVVPGFPIEEHIPPELM